MTAAARFGAFGFGASPNGQPLYTSARKLFLIILLFPLKSSGTLLEGCGVLFQLSRLQIPFPERKSANLNKREEKHLPSKPTTAKLLFPMQFRHFFSRLFIFCLLLCFKQLFEANSKDLLGPLISF